MTVKAILSMLKSPRYGFRPSEPSLAVGAGKSPVRCEPVAGASTTCHGKPSTARHSDFRDAPAPDRKLLCDVGEKMLRKSAGQPLTLVVMQVYDLPEVELVFGGTAAARAIHEVMIQLTRVATRKGFLVRSAADTFALLMPGTGAEATVSVLNERFGNPCAIEFEADGDEVLLVPDVRVHTLGAGESLQRVYERVCKLIAKERGREELRCDYIRKEREAHTLPMGLTSEAHPAPIRKAHYPELPATIPVPMGAR